jgi:hypothetical protein
MIGIIYKIKCLETDEFYIGSTNDIKRRIRQHKELRYSSKEIIKRNNYYFIILEKKEFPNNLSLKLLENLYIVIGRKTKRCVNFKLAYRTKNIDKYFDNISCKNYYYKNYDNCRKKQTEYRINNKDKLSLIGKENYKKNKENKKKKVREYREKNKDFVNRKVNCPNCNSLVNKSNITRHQRTIKCLNYN